MNRIWRSTTSGWLFLAMLAILSGCQATRFVDEGQYLLKSDPVIEHEGLISDELGNNAVRSRANRRMLLPKTALHTHNFGRRLEKLFRPSRPPIGPEEAAKSFGHRLLHLLKYRWGEPPVLLDTAQYAKDVQNLRNLYFAHGYFSPLITYEIDTLHKFLRPRRKKQKARVTFSIEAGRPYRLRQVQVVATDSGPDQAYLRWAYDHEVRNAKGDIIKADISQVLLQPGDRYDHARFEQERERGSNAVRNHQFPYFSPSDVRFVIDTSLQATGPDTLAADSLDRRFDLTIQLTGTHLTHVIDQIVVKVFPPTQPDGREDTALLRLVPGEVPEALRQAHKLSQKRFHDSLRMTFLVHPSLLRRVNFNFLAERISLWRIQSQQHIDQAYQQSRLIETQRNLQELGMVQYLLVNTEPLGPLPDPTLRPQPENWPLRAELELHLAPQYRIKAGAEAFTRDITAQNTTFLPSVGANLGFRNRNAFGKSELFEFTLSGSVGLLNRNDRFSAEVEDKSSSNTQLYYQFGSNAQLTYPRFLLSKLIKLVLPARMERRLFDYKPVTTLGLSGSFERFGEEFQQLAPGAQLTYKWRNHRTAYINSQLKTVQLSQFSPVSLTFINPSINVGLSDFQGVTPGSLIAVGQDRLDDLSREVLSLPPLLYQDFQPRLSSRAQLSFIHQNYRATRAFPTFWYRAAVETGGNLASLFEDVATQQGWESSATDNRLLNQFFYGHYVRGSLEGKLFFPLTETSELVLRGAIGGAFPLGNSLILPREARFFSGGLNSMRGWPSNTLGPGRVSTTGDLGGQDLLLATGDTIFAANNLLSSLSAPGGEYLFELNAEYRFDFIPALYLELAFFTDLGNVWLSQGAVNELSPNDPAAAAKAVLSRQNFSLGWDAGVGFRFDASFLIIRIDLGQQLYNPALGDWVIKREGLLQRRLFGETLRLNPSLAIGYPF